MSDPNATVHTGRSGGAFWFRMLVQAVVLNVPIAWSAAVGAVRPFHALVLSGVSGLITVLVWEPLAMGARDDDGSEDRPSRATDVAGAVGAFG